MLHGKAPGIKFIRLDDDKLNNDFGIMKKIRFYTDNVIEYDVAHAQCGQDRKTSRVASDALRFHHEHQRHDRDKYGIELDDQKGGARHPQGTQS